MTMRHETDRNFNEAVMGCCRFQFGKSDGEKSAMVRNSIPAEPSCMRDKQHDVQRTLTAEWYQRCIDVENDARSER